MFDFAWSELAIIGVIALVVVGPKDLPKLMRSAGKAAAQARRMADEFRGQMNEALRESELDDLRKSVDEIRSLDPRAMIRQEVAKLAEPVRAVADDVRNELSDAQGRMAAGLEPNAPADGSVPVIPDASPTLASIPMATDAPAAEPIDLVLPDLPDFVGPPDIPPAEPERPKAIDLDIAGAPLDLAPAAKPDMPAPDAAVPSAETRR